MQRSRIFNRQEKSRTSEVLGFLGKTVLGMLGLAAVSGGALLLHANLPAASLIYFLLVVLVALHWGFAQATILSVLAAVCQCYFFVPPFYSFYIADKQNYFVLAVFELSALLVSRIAAREHSIARDADAERRRMVMLYELSRRSLEVDLREHPGAQFLQLIKEIQLAANQQRTDWTRVEVQHSAR